MFLLAQRTHRAGRPLEARGLELPLAGTIQLRSKYDAQARRQQVLMELTPYPSTNVVYPEKPCDLLDPVPLAFDSERGMIMTGFELINGARHYQGWWIRWFPEMPNLCRN